MYYDLHAHILPGVDDGPAHIADAVAIARIAAENGTRMMLATPHRKDITENWSVPHIRNLTVELQRRIDAERIPITLTLGMENHIDETLPCHAADGRALTMNGSRYILVEMPFFGQHDFVEGALTALQAQGLTPVFAHPERIETFQRCPALLKRYIAMGMLSQITRGSLLGHWGEPARQFTLELLEQGLAHMLASDTHAPKPPRTPELGRRYPHHRRCGGLMMRRCVWQSTSRALSSMICRCRRQAWAQRRLSAKPPPLFFQPADYLSGRDGE